MDGLSVEVKLCRGDCSLVVSSDKFASPFTLAVEQTCASVEHHILTKVVLNLEISPLSTKVASRLIADSRIL
jgi:hypothetical protein